MKIVLKYLRSILLFLILGLLVSCQNGIVSKKRTIVSMEDDKFLINGEVTYKSKNWKGNSIEGLIINSRMVQGIFDDLNTVTVDTFAYPDTKKWEPDRNTAEFIAAMPEWKKYGLNCFTLNMQGGSPFGYGNIPCLNPGFNPDGSLMPAYMNRLEKILNKADELEMAVILGIFYFGQDQNIKDEQSVIAAVNNLVDWLFEKEYRNVLIEISNETNYKSYDHPILLPERIHELVELVRNKEKNGYRFLVSTSFPAPITPTPEAISASDFVLFHANALRTTQLFNEKIETVKSLVGDRAMPLVINEDDNYFFGTDTSHFEIALKNHISWGYFDYRRKGVTDLKEGFQSVPVDWTINSENKKAFFNKVKEITGGL